jgi:hypothetical protein
MNEQWKEALARIRQRLRALRSDYNAGRMDRHALKLDNKKRERFERADVQLRALVPLYRTFSAISQQKCMHPDVLPRSWPVYMKKFARYQAVLTSVAGYPAYGRLEQHLGDGTGELLFPDPARNWELRRVADIYEDLRTALENRRAVQLQQRYAAEAARKAFLGSLAPEQADLLGAAMAAAKAIGVHAVTFDERDFAS